jgi:hypothetical protein
MSEQDPSFADLVSAYGVAAKKTQFWTEHGSHGDAKLTEAAVAEYLAFAAVMKAYRAK